MGDLLLQYPDVLDAAVCAVYNNSLATEVLLAYVNLSPEHMGWEEVSGMGVLEHIRTCVDGKVAGYRRWRGGVHHLQMLPKTTMVKILRKDRSAKLKEVLPMKS